MLKSRNKICSAAILYFMAGSIVLHADELNVALSQWGTTASASSEYGPGYEAWRAFDGKWAVQETDKWNSANNQDPHWLMIDLGAERTIHKVVLKHEGVHANGDLFNTSVFQLQCSNSPDGPWSDLAAPVEGNTSSVTTHSFSPITTRYVRLYITKGEPGSNSYARIYEMEVYSDPKTLKTPLTAITFPQAAFSVENNELRIEAHVEVAPAEVLHQYDFIHIYADGKKVGRMDVSSLKSSGTIRLPARNTPLLVELFGETAVEPVLLGRQKLQTPMPLSWDYFADGTVSLICSSHNDIAWFDTPEKTILRRETACITPALARMANREDVYFSMENVLYLQEYLDLHPERKEDIAKVSAAGYLDWGATYNQPYEGLLSGEQLVRQVYHGAKYIRTLLPGVSARVAYNVDVPGRTMQMPQVLSKAGIPYLVLSRHQSGLFKWGSPDGSEILCWSMGHYYYHHQLYYQKTTTDFLKSLHAGMTGLWNDFFEEKQLPKDYPALFSMDYVPAADFDRPIQETENIRREFQPLAGAGRNLIPPQLKYASTEQYFDKVSQYSSNLDKIVGDRPDVWLYIHGPTHHRAISAKRHAGIVLPMTEMFSTVDAVCAESFENYPAAELNKAWADSIYDDHGWGGENGHITDNIFKAKLEDAGKAADKLLRTALLNIAARVKVNDNMPPPVMIFNGLSWPRTDPVYIEAELDPEVTVVDSQGHDVPCQFVKLSNWDFPKLVFIAKDVPSIGYKTYHLPLRKKTEKQTAKAKIEKAAYENDFYEIRLGKGGIERLFDKQVKAEVLNTDKYLGGEVIMMHSEGNGAGEFGNIQPVSMKDFARTSITASDWKIKASGPVCVVYEMTAELEHCNVKQELVVYHDIKKIDCYVALLEWDGTESKEFRMVLPVNNNNGQVAYEVPFGVVEVGKSEIEKAAKEWYSTICKEMHPREVQNFISSSDERVGLTMSSSVAVCDFKDSTENPADYPMLQPVLLASRRSCHGSGNWYLQAGDHYYNFSILSHQPGWENGIKFSYSANNPLMAVIRYVSGRHVNLPDQHSFASVSGDNVMISTIKKCEDDNNVIVRLYDIEGKDSEVTLNTFFSMTGAERTNIIEEDGKSIPVSGKTLNAKIGHHAIETFKLLPSGNQPY
jgi:alpha-mannosidase